MDIIMDPKRVDENADQIETLGRQMKEKMQEVNAKVKSLRDDWKDLVKDTYDEDFAKLVKNFESFLEFVPPYAREAHEHAEQMRRIGKG